MKLYKKINEMILLELYMLLSYASFNININNNNLNVFKISFCDPCVILFIKSNKKASLIKPAF